MAKTIDKELDSYIAQLNPDQKKSLLAVIKSFLEKTPDAEFDIAQYNQELDEAMARINSGSFITQEDLEKEVAGW